MTMGGPRTPPVTRVVAHPLTGTADRPVDARSGEPFDTRTYSLMKHGDLPAMQRLADELAEALIAQCPSLLTDPRALILPVAYLVAPPACKYLADRIAERLNALRAAGPAARVVHVRKDAVTHIDYAASSAQDRQNDLASIGFRLSEPVCDAIAIVVDDVRVTGLAEQVMVELLQSSGVGQIVAAYVATCDEQLAADPSVEAALNHAAVRSIHDMLPSVRRGDYVPTIRFLKRLLADPDAAGFLAACPTELVRRFCADARGTGEQFLAAYPAGTAALFAESEARSAARPRGAGR